MKQRIIYGLLAGLFMGLYWLTWTGAMLFVFIIAASLFLYLISERLRHRDAHLLGIVGVVVAGGITALIFAGKILPRVLSGPTAITTIELESLTPLMAFLNFGFIIFLIPVALGLLIYQAVKKGEAPLILLLVWSLIMLVAMLEYRRYAYYFAINASLLTGWFAWYVWQHFKEKTTAFAVFVVTLLLVVMIVPNAQHAVAMAKQNYLSPSDAWCETLEWVEKNTPGDSVILSWWDYGYWINRMAQREAYVNPSQKEELVTNTARMFLSGEGVEADYIILDYDTVAGKFWAIATWAGKPQIKYKTSEYSQSFVVRLYNSDAVGEYILVYESRQKIDGVPEVKVFKRE